MFSRQVQLGSLGRVEGGASVNEAQNRRRLLEVESARRESLDRATMLLRFPEPGQSQRRASGAKS